MVVLALGDVVGEAGCEHVRKKLPELKSKYGVDIVMVNGENSAEGNGMTPFSVQHLFDSGADVITSGNHALRRRQIYDVLDKKCGLIRPANYHESAPGVGMYLYDNCRFQLCVINLQGVVYLQSLRSPFECIDELLKKVDTPNILVDFHAEATAEKICLAHYLDGRVSAVVGTHTHVPTADARVLPGGTGYMTDIGMCGGLGSVLGVKSEDAVHRMRTGLPTRFNNDDKDIRLSGAVLTIDHTTGRCTGIETIIMV